MVQIVTEIVSGLVAGISQMATGIGGGIAQLIQNVFLKMGENNAIVGLSTTGIVIVAFAGVSLAIGLSKFIVKWAMSLGARK